MPYNQKEIDTIRELARRVAEFAACKENKLNIQRWKDVNALRKPDRAPVWCRPMSCWGELIPASKYVCRDPYLHSIEARLRKVLFKREINDDEPVDSTFFVETYFNIEPKNLYGVEIAKHHSGEKGGAWSYEPPLKTPEDFDKLKLPVFTYNKTKTEDEMSRAHEILGDILPVKRICVPPGATQMSDIATALRGTTELLLDTVAEPELLHRLMAFLRDWMLSAMKQVEDADLLTRFDTKPTFISDPVGPEPVNGKITYKNLWFHANSQAFDQVSPEGWKEFDLKYQMSVMEKYGYVNYGCCENLTHKIDGVLSIPNLRLVTCSAWTNLDVIIEKCAAKYAIMWRQKATDVVFPKEDSVIKTALFDGARRLQSCKYQIVLRELETLAGHLDRLHVWTRYAKEAAEKYR